MCRESMQDPMEVFVGDECTLPAPQQYYLKFKDTEKNHKLFDLLDMLEFKHVAVFIKPVQPCSPRPSSSWSRTSWPWPTRNDCHTISSPRFPVADPGGSICLQSVATSTGIWRFGKIFGINHWLQTFFFIYKIFDGLCANLSITSLLLFCHHPHHDPIHFTGGIDRDSSTPVSLQGCSKSPYSLSITS